MSNQKDRTMQLYYALPNENLRAYLGSQEKGKSLVVTTPWGDSEPIESILEDWDGQLTEIQGAWPSLYDFEMEMRSKVGPLSVQKPLSERLDTIKAYYKADNKPGLISSAAEDQLLDEWQGVAGLRLKSKPKVLMDMRLSTNSGSPYFTKRKLVAERELTAQIQRISEGQWSVSYEDGQNYLLTATLGWRGQEGGPSVDDVKQRVLWMFPMSANIHENMVYQPLIAAAQRTNVMATWNGNEAVNDRATQLFQTKRREDDIVCTDFTTYDAYFGRQCQEITAYLLSELFSNSDDIEWWNEQIFPIKYNIPICLSWGNFMTGSHGMGSGSGGTNADESLMHRYLQHAAATRQGSFLNRNSMVLGDDGCLTYPGIAVDSVVDTYKSYGLVMNKSKQLVSKDHITFLKHWHHQDYLVNGRNVGVYSTMRALGRLRFMERYVDPDKWGAKAVAMRELSIIENCKYHPLFPKFVEFCAERDKYRLGVDIPGFMRNIDAVYDEAKTNDTLVVSYSQEWGYQKPPSEWEVVKILTR